MPRIQVVPSDVLSFRVLLEAMLGPEGKRRMALKDKTNEELFQLYDSDLILRLNNPKNLSDTRTIPQHFREFLGENPPSADLAKPFLAQFMDRKPRTRYRYAQMVKSFMKWYGEPLDDVNVKVPKSLPSYTEDSDIQKLLMAIGDKRSHKGCVTRDTLMVEVGLRTGLRRSELANLEVKDVYVDLIIVRGGKGNKDRMIPLTVDLAKRLRGFISNKKPFEKVFGLGGPTLGMKVKQFARRAGLHDFHTHSLRHKFATDLLEAGVNIRVVQALLGHQNLNTTEVYLSITDQSLFEAVKLLNRYKSSTPGTVEIRDDVHHKVIESSVEICMTPPAPDSGFSVDPPPFSTRFDIDLESDNVLIESIQVRSSDPEVPYRLFIFESHRIGDDFNTESEDLIQMDYENKRVYTYSRHIPLPYSDQDRQHKLHGAISIKQRFLRFDFYGRHDRETIAYYEAPVNYTITLRYKLK